LDQAELYIGKKAELNRGLLKLRYPVEHGVIKHWGDMEAIWNYAYGEMKISQLEHPVLLTEPILNPYANRERMAEIFFETYTAPAVFICSQALLSLYASGKATGVVLDCGDGVCQCTSVYDGFMLNNTAQRIDMGGREVTEYLNVLLRKSGHIFSTTVSPSIKL
jgi:centractin